MRFESVMSSKWQGHVVAFEFGSKQSSFLPLLIKWAHNQIDLNSIKLDWIPTCPTDFDCLLPACIKFVSSLVATVANNTPRQFIMWHVGVFLWLLSLFILTRWSSLVKRFRQITRTHHLRCGLMPIRLLLGFICFEQNEELRNDKTLKPNPSSMTNKRSEAKQTRSKWTGRNGPEVRFGFSGSIQKSWGATKAQRFSCFLSTSFKAVSTLFQRSWRPKQRGFEMSLGNWLLRDASNGSSFWEPANFWPRRHSWHCLKLVASRCCRQEFTFGTLTFVWFVC